MGGVGGGTEVDPERGPCVLVVVAWSVCPWVPAPPAMESRGVHQREHPALSVACFRLSVPGGVRSGACQRLLAFVCVQWHVVVQAVHCFWFVTVVVVFVYMVRCVP